MGGVDVVPLRQRVRPLTPITTLSTPSVLATTRP